MEQMLAIENKQTNKKTNIEAYPEYWRNDLCSESWMEIDGITCSLVSKFYK